MRQLERNIATTDALKINSSGLFGSNGQYRRSPVTTWTSSEPTWSNVPRQAPVSAIQDSAGLSAECFDDAGRGSDLCSNLLAAWG